jgi:RHS repeat-associated protein
MRNIVTLVGFLCLLSSSLWAQHHPTAPYRYNQVKQEQIKTAGYKQESQYGSLTPEQKSMVMTYRDGFGRSLATIAVQASPQQKDLVALYSYGRHGLVDTTFLPYASAYASGAFAGIQQASSDQKNFYQITSDKVATDAYPFAVPVYDASPLNYLTEQGTVGATQQPGGYTTKQTQRLNADTEIRRWDGATYTSPGYYPASSLVVMEVTDAHGRILKSYIDKSGRVVEKHEQTGPGTWLKTRFIYDAIGRLVLMLQPAGVNMTGSATTIASSVVNQYGFTYVYDQRNRLVEKKMPGAAPLYYIYDPLDRMVLMQDGNLRATNQWMYIKYDKRQRAVLSGLYTNATQTTRSAVQALADALPYATGSTWYEYRLTGGDLGYSNQSFPTTNIQPLTASYYDSYDLDGNGTDDYTYAVQGLADEGTPWKTAGRTTAVKKRILGTSDWLTQYIFYDAQGRTIQVRSNNHLSATLDNLSTWVYNFDGTVQSGKSYHHGVTGQEITTRTRFAYDHAGRVKQIYHTINNQTEVLAVEYEYNDVGQVVDKKLHGTGGGNFLQSVDFRYTIQGQLESINNASLQADSRNDDTNDYFGLELLYNTVDAGLGNTAQHTGNISAIKWKGPGALAGAADQRSYTFAYDAGNRLTAAAFRARGESTWDQESDVHNEAISYDANGNITSLQRNQRKYDWTGALPKYVSEPVDDLTYTYATADGNKLEKVEDASGKTAGFNNGAAQSTEYSYDAAGNLISDLNKGISSMVYNELGKPSQITFSDGRVQQYTYDAAGTRLRMSLTQNSVTVTTDYVEGYVYEGGQLRFFGSPEGRVVKNGSAYEYQYAIADHQGNTRVVFTSATPQAEVATADFESASNASFGNYPSGAARNNWTAMNHTPAGTYSQLLNGGINSQVGVAKSYKVYPGDKIKVQAYGRYNANGNPANLTGFTTALLSAFNLVAPAPGETGTPAAALESWGSVVAGGNGVGEGSAPRAFVNILQFDKNFNFLDIAYEQIAAGATTVHDLMEREITVREEGYVFVYLSNENASQVDVYFDDVEMTYTPGNIVQYNEYYPYGMQASTSWTRENAVGNSFLYNASSELNSGTALYDLPFRNYDPVLGRFNQIDPLAESSMSLTPYQYGNNDPVFWNDPSGLISAADFYQQLEDLLNTQYGGNWVATEEGGSSRAFGSSEDAFIAGVSYLDRTNGWTYTEFPPEMTFLVFNLLESGVKLNDIVATLGVDKISGRRVRQSASMGSKGYKSNGVIFLDEVVIRGWVEPREKQTQGSPCPKCSNAWVKDVEVGIDIGFFRATITSLQLMTADDARKFIDAEETRIEKNASHFSRTSYAVSLLTLKASPAIAATLATISFVGGEMYGDVAQRYDSLEGLINSIHSQGVYIKVVDTTSFGSRSTLSTKTVSIYTYDGQLIGELGY